MIDSKRCDSRDVRRQWINRFNQPIKWFMPKNTAVRALSLLLIVLFSEQIVLLGAFSSTMQWDVRTTGLDTNGGGFDPGVSVPGTDFSLQNGPQISYTDIVVGATTTQGTSVLHPFDATIPGNVINITAGAGCTVQRAEVLSVSGITATFDKSLGTAASSCTGALGGSLLTVDFVTKNTAVFTNGNTLNIKAGTYSRTTTWVIDTSAASGNLMIIGYNATHNDGGTKPLITTATNTNKLIQVGSSKYTFKNMSFSNTAGTRADGVWFALTNQEGVISINCIWDGFAVAINGDNGAGSAGSVHLFNTEVKNGTSDGIRAFFMSGVFAGSWIHNNTGHGVVQENSSNSSTTVDHSAISANGGSGIVTVGGAASIFPTTVTNSAIVANTADGILATTPPVLRIFNSVIYGNGGFGIHATTDATTNNVLLYFYNAFGGPNVSGNYSSTLPAGIGDITLTANPFVSSSNFALNSTAGGGAALKQAGFPGVSIMGTGYLDVGPLQTSGAPGSGATASAYIQ